MLVIDSNDPTRRNITKLAIQTKMRDAHVTRHGNEGEPETYSRGTERIDFMYATEKVLHAIRKCGIGSYGEICDGDHRHLFVDVDLEWLLGGKAPTMISATRRTLKTSSPKHMTKYCQVLRQQLERQNLALQQDLLVEDIQHTGRITATQQTELNRLDAALTEAKLEAERQSGKLATAPWSPKLIQARRKVRYWDLWRKEKRLNRDFTRQRNSLKLADE